MNAMNEGSHGNEGPPRDKPQHDPRPYWKRARHDFRFSLGLILMLTAIAIFVLSDNLAFLPRN